MKSGVSITAMSDALTEVTQWGCMQTEIWGYVGIDTLQEQIRKKALKRGFEFNILVVGRSGLGKSTLVNTLFKSYVSRKSCASGEKSLDDGVYEQTMQIKSVTHILEEKGVRLCLTVTDTPGFGDQINNENCWLPIQEYINEQYEKYLQEEHCVSRKTKITDTRIHCCLYFIQPTGHWLTPLDIEFMKRLDKMVNVVPVIAKSDALTIEERYAFKQMIKRGLAENFINVYPMKETDEDEEDVVFNNKIREVLPFAVVGSDKQFDVNGKMVYGRKTGWGVVEVENKNHCEFSHLRDMLIRTHMQDLIDVTRLVHYEKYRKERLLAQHGEQPMNDKNDRASPAATNTQAQKTTKVGKENKLPANRAQLPFYPGFHKAKGKHSPLDLNENINSANNAVTTADPSQEIPESISEQQLINMDNLNESSL